MTNKITIHLAAPRGFCAGVDRAIEIVKKTTISQKDPYKVKVEKDKTYFWCVCGLT